MAKLSEKVSKLCGVEREAKQLQDHNKLLERQLEQTLKQLEAARKSKIDIQRAVGKQSGKRGKPDVFCRVLISDTHGASIHIPTIKAILADIAVIQPREIILLGDHLECGGFLAQHHTLGYVAQTEYTFEDDVAAGNQLLDQLQIAAPKATKEYLEGNHECLSPDHEVLTSNGWLPIAQVTTGHLVAGMTERGMTVWQKPVKTHEYAHSGDMILLEGQSVSVKMTGNHRVPYIGQYKKKLKYKSAGEIYANSEANPCGTVNVPVSSVTETADNNTFSDDELQLLAWLLTYGCLSTNTMNIYQSKVVNLPKIENVLLRLGIRFSDRVRDRESSFGGNALQSQAYCIAAASRRKYLRKFWAIENCTTTDKRIPAWVWSLSGRQFDVFMDAVIDADGTRVGTASCVYKTYEFLSELQAMAVVRGYSCSLVFLKRKSGKPGYWCLNVKRRATNKLTMDAVKKQHYAGPVYCLTTGTSNFFIRRSGKVSLTGNSRVEKWIVDATVGNSRDAAMLRRTIGPEHVLFLEKRGIPFYAQGKFYDGLRIPGTIKRQNCHFTHGIYINESAALKHVRKYGGNVVFGHIHRSQSAIIRTVSSGEIGGWCAGCICELQPMWQHTNCTDWSHGYGLQLVQGERFLHINIPVLEGLSMMGPLANQLRLG